MIQLLVAALVLVVVGVVILFATGILEFNSSRVPQVEVSFPTSTPAPAPTPAFAAPALPAPRAEVSAPANAPAGLPPEPPTPTPGKTTSLTLAPTSAPKPTLTVPHIFALLEQGKMTAEEAKRLLAGRDNPVMQHIEAKEYLLDLINAKRSEAGVPELVLGDNRAAQLHAEAAMEGCFSSHWGADGLKPYIRYSLAGGYQSNAENISGLGYCLTEGDGYQAVHSIEQEMRDAMQSWMASEGHRRNILDPWHRKVNIGVAWDRYNSMLVQHFEGDYVDYRKLPSIEDGILSFSGGTKNGGRAEDGLKISLRTTCLRTASPGVSSRGPTVTTRAESWRHSDRGWAQAGAIQAAPSPRRRRPAPVPTPLRTTCLRRARRPPPSRPGAGPKRPTAPGSVARLLLPG